MQLFVQGVVKGIGKNFDLTEEQNCNVFPKKILNAQIILIN